MLNLDKAIIKFDNILRGQQINKDPSKTYPAAKVENSTQLTESERRKSISMMRINHSGEVCAQALYQGQALMAKNIAQHNSLLQAATEENAHLSWCKQRLFELDGRPSLLNPIWYVGSFGIGVLAGAAGDKISLGFLAETEYQVTAHLEKHLYAMPSGDQKSKAILQQMRDDELQHATNAKQAGGVELPLPIKVLMRCTARILTLTASKL